MKLRIYHPLTAKKDPAEEIPNSPGTIYGPHETISDHIQFAENMNEKI